MLAVTQFGGGSETVGLLFSAVGAGALLAALTAGWVRQGAPPGPSGALGRSDLGGSGSSPSGLAGDRLGLAFGCLAVAGGADVVSAVFRGTILQPERP